MLVSTLFVILGVVVSFQHSSAARKRYDGYKVFDVLPTTRAELSVLHEMKLQYIYIDFWKAPSRLNKLVTFMVPHKHVVNVVTQLRKAGIAYTIAIENVQNVLTPMWEEIDQRLEAEQTAFNLSTYNRLEEIYDWMDNDLIASCHSGVVCETYTIGSSYLGEPLKIFKIGAVDGVLRPGFWFDATIHAREWITTATISNIMDIFATGSIADAVRLTDSYDFYFLPIMNPDGYKYSWTTDRMWRKNRRPSSPVCDGTDLNRNYDFRWGNEGASTLPCAEDYMGESPASEQETQFVQNEMLRLSPYLTAAVTIHAYGNMFMFPWGNTVDYAGEVCDRTTDYDDLMSVANDTANAIQATYDTSWDRGTSCEVIYATTGGTDDYAKGGANIKYAYCPELRGSGFVIPATEIPYSVNEFWNGIVAMVDSIYPPSRK